jgi:hypothetical protein
MFNFQIENGLDVSNFGSLCKSIFVAAELTLLFAESMFENEKILKYKRERRKGTRFL